MTHEERLADAGDDRITKLYDRTARDVYRYASRLTGGDRQQTHDLVHDTFVHLIQRVRDGRVDPADIEVGWLIRSCRQRYLDQLRRQRRQRSREERSTRDLRIVSASLPDGDPTAMLAALSPEHRVALVLRYVDDLSTREVAAALDRSVRATESLLVRARAALRDSATVTEGDRS